MLRILSHCWKRDWDSPRGDGYFLFAHMEYTDGGISVRAHPAIAHIVRTEGRWTTTTFTSGGTPTTFSETFPRRCQAKRLALREAVRRMS